MPSASDIDDESIELGRYRLNAQDLRTCLTEMNKKGKELAILMQYANKQSNTPYNKKIPVTRFIHDVKRFS
jgi:uncharacterized protein YicC (UPF0701 family)